MNELQPSGTWHVGRHLVGHFPMTEASCPCPKARCGLAAPVEDITCKQHADTQALRQSHHEQDCQQYLRRLRRKRLAR